MRSIEEIVGDLESFEFDSSAHERLEQLSDEIEQHPNGISTVRSVLKLFERFPDEDFGAPGPLAHAIESFYGAGYERELLESVKREPTLLTLWLCNRIANAGDSCSADFVSALRLIAMSSPPDSDLGQQAAHFAGLHA